MPNFNVQQEYYGMEFTPFLNLSRECKIPRVGVVGGTSFPVIWSL
jgi:hypothetical protein